MASERDALALTGPEVRNSPRCTPSTLTGEGPDMLEELGALLEFVKTRRDQGQWGE